MNRVGEFVLKQSKSILENKQHALFYAILFAVLPFASWLSVSVMALITLRKGAKSGLDILLPASIIHSVPLMMLIPVDSALVNTAIEYIPCYLAALSLRKASNWQAVCFVLLAQALIAFLLLGVIAPHFAEEQFIHFKKMVSHYEEYQQLFDRIMSDISSDNLAQLFLGVQILSVTISTLTSLIFARGIQAKLVKPGGLQEELLEFRGNRISLIVLLALSVASYYEMPWALNLLPIALAYFFAAGLGLINFVLSRKWQLKVVILLVLLILFKPILMFVYVIFGTLDSLFNFRLYLPARRENQFKGF
jgi:hypothetical protein